MHCDWWCGIATLYSYYTHRLYSALYTYFTGYTLPGDHRLLYSPRLWSPGTIRLERALSTIHLCSIQFRGSGCYTFYLMHLCSFIQADNSKRQWSSCWPCAISCAQVYTFQGAADAAWNLCRTMIKAMHNAPCSVNKHFGNVCRTMIKAMGQLLSSSYAYCLIHLPCDRPFLISKRKYLLSGR